MTTDVFQRLHHICLVVEDVERTSSYLTRLGIGPWHPYPASADFVETSQRGDIAPGGSRVLCAQVGGIELQVCQPPADHHNPERGFLQQHGPGVHHLGFEVDDLDGAEAQAARMGLAWYWRGRRSDGSGFCYFVSDDRFGTTLEIRKTPHHDLEGC